MSHDVRDLLPCPFCGSDVEEVQKGKLLSLRCPPHSPCIGGWLLSCGDSEHRAEMHKTWNTRATLSPDPVLLGEVREALERIALPKVGLQGIAEDYGNDTNAYNFHAMRYFARLSQTYQRTAANALAKLPKLTGEEV